MKKQDSSVSSPMNRLIVIFVALFCACTLQAQNDSLRLSTTSHMIGVGAADVLDTYLSQEKFTGIGFTFLADIERERNGSRWHTVMQHQARFASLHDRSDTEKELEGAYDFYWGRYYTLTSHHSPLTTHLGFLINAGAGFIYNTSNSNNPAQARAHLNLMPSARASYRFTLWNRPMKLCYELDMPLVGIMFSPNYGQSYYEIFNRGNYDHNIVPTTFVSAPTFRQQLMLNVGLGRSFTMRIGYLGDYQQAKVNNLKQHIYSHNVMIGIVRRFQLINYRP